MGENTGDDAGYTLHAAGDFNGDGFADFVIGAPGADHGKSNSGSAYLIYGTAAGLPSPLNLGSLSSAQGFRMDGEAVGDGFGMSPAPVM